VPVPVYKRGGLTPARVPSTGGGRIEIESELDDDKDKKPPRFDPTMQDVFTSQPAQSICTLDAKNILHFNRGVCVRFVMCVTPPLRSFVHSIELARDLHHRLLFARLFFLVRLALRAISCSFFFLMIVPPKSHLRSLVVSAGAHQGIFFDSSRARRPRLFIRAKTQDGATDSARARAGRRP
jgi:hypothetical protein